MLHSTVGAKAKLEMTRFEWQYPYSVVADQVIGNWETSDQHSRARYAHQYGDPVYAVRLKRFISSKIEPSAGHQG